VGSRSAIVARISDPTDAFGSNPIVMAACRDVGVGDPEAAVASLASPIDGVCHAFPFTSVGLNPPATIQSPTPSPLVSLPAVQPSGNARHVSWLHGVASGATGASASA